MTLSRRDFLAGAGAVTAVGTASMLTGVAPASAGITRVRELQSPVTLTMWTDHPEWVAQVNPIVSQFEKENPGITIQVIAKSGAAYPTLITSALAAGTAPDIFGSDAGGGYETIAKSGHWIDLTGKVNISQLNSASTSLMPVNGKIYGVPLFGEYTIGFYYWRPIFEKYHLSAPTTWPEFTNVCSTLLKQGIPPLSAPSADGIMPTFMWCGLLTSVRGVPGEIAIDKGKAKLTDPEFLSATSYMKSLVPYFLTGWASTGYSDGKDFFAAGNGSRGVITVGGSADYTAFKNVNPKVDLGFFAFPHPGTSGVPAVNSGPDFFYGLNSRLNPAKVAAGIKFLNYFCTVKVGSQVAQTIEMPDVKGARVTEPIFEQIIQQSGNDGPVWYSLAPLSTMWTYALANIADMLLGHVTPAAFNATCQSKIVPAM